MRENLIEHVKEFEKAEIGGTGVDWSYETDTIKTDDYTLMLGDSVERMAEIADESVDLSVFSPPFSSLYTYTPTERDIGNCRTEEEFFRHFGFIIDNLLRVTKPGRNCAVHVAQIPAMLARDGYIGLKDFRGKTIEAFESHGWIFHGDITIDKDPQAQAIRTHSKALLFTQLKKDSSWLRPALADYILVFRKPGENAVPIHPDLTNNEWIEWARPIWYGIKETDTLNYTEARESADERHICPLQLGTIERCIRLWSNPGETVCSPFAGIASEGHVSIKQGRKFIGIELKRNYFNVGARNLKAASENVHTADLFAVNE
jgi:DNA modification methylase